MSLAYAGQDTSEIIEDEFKSATDGEKDIRRWKVDPAFAAVGILEIMLTESGYPVDDTEDFAWDQTRLIDNGEYSYGDYGNQNDYYYDEGGNFKRKKRWINSCEDIEDESCMNKEAVFFEEYINSFDGFVEDIENEMAPEGAMLIDEIVDAVKNHGCWGQKLDPTSGLHTAYQGIPIDDLDHSTKLYSQCRHCLSHTGGGCGTDHESLEIADTQTMYIRLVTDYVENKRAWQCETDQNECDFSMCECALNWAGNVKNWLNNNNGQIEPEIYEETELEESCLKSRTSRPSQVDSSASTASTGGSGGSSQIDSLPLGFKSTGISELDAYAKCMDNDNQLRKRR